jgi:SNF2 family DNA or RNA helicase
MIWYGITWNSEEYDQAIARIARQGQKNHVYVHRILTEDSVDGRIAAALSIKGLTQDNLIGALL